MSGARCGVALSLHLARRLIRLALVVAPMRIVIGDGDDIIVARACGIADR